MPRTLLKYRMKDEKHLSLRNPDLSCHIMKDTKYLSLHMYGLYEGVCEFDIKFTCLRLNIWIY